MGNLLAEFAQAFSRALPLAAWRKAASDAYLPAQQLRLVRAQLP
jgi:hypothetical protein